MASRQSPMRTPRSVRERAAYLRGTGVSLKETAKEVGVGKSTVHGWETPGGRHYDPGHAAMIETIKAEWRARLDDLMGDATKGLKGALDRDADELSARDYSTIMRDVGSTIAAIDRVEVAKMKAKAELEAGREGQTTTVRLDLSDLDPEQLRALASGGE